MYAKGIHVLSDMSYMGIDWSHENDCPVIRCAYDKANCPNNSAKMRDACKSRRERALIEVLRSTGARVGELVEITLDQIDWNTGDIIIQSEKSDR
jgi:hypothetical protein